MYRICNLNTEYIKKNLHKIILIKFKLVKFIKKYVKCPMLGIVDRLDIRLYLVGHHAVHISMDHL